jgi:hypothetical protein
MAAGTVEMGEESPGGEMNDPRVSLTRPRGTERSKRKTEQTITFVPV